MSQEFLIKEEDLKAEGLEYLCLHASDMCDFAVIKGWLRERVTRRLVEAVVNGESSVTVEIPWTVEDTVLERFEDYISQALAEEVIRKIIPQRDKKTVL